MSSTRLQRFRSVLADTRPLRNPAFRRLWIADSVTVIGALTRSVPTGAARPGDSARSASAIASSARVT